MLGQLRACPEPRPAVPWLLPPPTRETRGAPPPPPVSASSTRPRAARGQSPPGNFYSFSCPPTPTPPQHLASSAFLGRTRPRPCPSAAPRTVVFAVSTSAQRVNRLDSAMPPPGLSRTRAAPARHDPRLPQSCGPPGS
nr:actin nucleation-promoting factor WASL-like [Pongo pygmaeus]